MLQFILILLFIIIIIVSACREIHIFCLVQLPTSLYNLMSCMLNTYNDFNQSMDQSINHVLRMIYRDKIG